MVKTIMTIKLKNEEKVIVVYLPCKNSRLAVHKATYGSGWTITHIKSSYRCVPVGRDFKKRSDAEKVAMALEPADPTWDQINPTLLSSIIPAKIVARAQAIALLCEFAA